MNTDDSDWTDYFVDDSSGQNCFTKVKVCFCLKNLKSELLEVLPIKENSSSIGKLIFLCESVRSVFVFYSLTFSDLPYALALRCV